MTFDFPEMDCSHLYTNHTDLKTLTFPRVHPGHTESAREGVGEGGGGKKVTSREKVHVTLNPVFRS